MPCPNCSGASLTERSSFKAVAEPVEGAAPTTVTVDLMGCERCAINFPSIRGRRKYTLVPPQKLSTLMAELEEAKQRNSEILGSVKLMEKRSHSLAAEIEDFKLRSEISSLERRIGGLESENKGLELRRTRLRETIELIASRINAPAPPRRANPSRSENRPGSPSLR
ncbi:MAG TPA: hypothetical protein VND41_04095 [Nitrososphaerales archaeon]|nr:hypothetical protein [Nitrososphaerales archaeon]